MKKQTERLTISVTEAAEILGISRNLAYSLARRGELPGVIQLGRRRLVISRAALLKLLENEAVAEGDATNITKEG